MAEPPAERNHYHPDQRGTRAVYPQQPLEEARSSCQVRRRHNDYYTGAPTTERSYIHYIPNYIYLRGERHDLIHAPA